MSGRSLGGRRAGAAGGKDRRWPGADRFDGVLDQARNGDEESFSRLWNWLQPPLLGWLRVTNPGTEEELAAETWIYVARKLRWFRGDSLQFRSWVFTTARRRSIDAARRRRRMPVRSDGGGGSDVIDVTDGRHDPQLALVAQCDRQDALELLGLLPPNQAQVVGLRVLAGLSVAETAEVVGKTEGAVRVLCHRGLQTLAALAYEGEWSGEGVTEDLASTVTSS